VFEIIKLVVAVKIENKFMIRLEGKMKWLMLFIVLVFLWCSENENPTDSSTNNNPTLTGNWFGSDTSHNFAMTALLSQDGDLVTGVGQVDGAAATYTGINLYPVTFRW